MLTAVKGTYDNGQIIWDETPPVQRRTKVIVTFLENETATVDKRGTRFGSLAGKISIPADFSS